MNDLPYRSAGDSAQQAADWTLRIDRGLTPEEQDAFSQWLAEHPQNGEAFARSQWCWSELDRLAGLQSSLPAAVDPDLLDPTKRRSIAEWPPRRRRAAAVTLALAACVALAFLVIRFPSANVSEKEPRVALSPLMARIESLDLSDGSRIELNRGAMVETSYTPAERRVRLVRGEAHFDVAKDPDRPFVVEVAGVDVRAVGTMFNVKYTRSEVDVLVTEGRVSLDTDGARDVLGQPGAEPSPLLAVGQRGIVSLSDRRTVAVSTLTEAERDEALRWKPRLLDFESAPLNAIVAEFNRSNPITLIIGDDALRDLRLSSAFWSDNVEGFVRLMESGFGMSAE